MKHALFLVFFLFGASVCYAGPVNINTADATTLAQELNGVGLSRAKAIVAWREQNGPFKSVEELGRVKGIGPRVIQKNRSDIRLSDPESESD